MFDSKELLSRYVEALDADCISRVWLRVDLCAASWLPHWLIDYASERALTRATAWLKPNVEQLWLLGRGFGRFLGPPSAWGVRKILGSCKKGT